MEHMLDVDQNKKLNMRDFYPNVVRTGTLSEGSCFLHAVLKGLNKENYSSMSKTEKLEYMKKIRDEISESLSLDYYRNNMISISSLGLSIKLVSFLKIIYDFIENPEDFLKKTRYTGFLVKIINSNSVIFKMITTVISQDEFVDIINRPFITSSNTIDEYVKNYSISLYQLFLQKLNEEDVKINDDRLDICKTKIKRFCESICNFIVDKQFKKYKKEIKTTSEWVSDLMFQLISDYFNIDIYFIDVNKRNVYIDHLIKRNRPSVVIGWLNGNHFENIGILLENKTIKRLFQPDYPFISKIRGIRGIREV